MLEDKVKLKLNFQSGQALLIVLLTLTVALTIVLSIVSRSVTDITVTTYQEDAQRAFNAAEAGIEQVLLQEVYTSIPETILPNDAKYQVATSSAFPSGDEYVYPSELLSGESATFWLISHDPDDDLTCGAMPCAGANRINEICWGEEGTTVDDFAPAIEVSVYYDESLPNAVNNNDFSAVKVARFAFDPHATRVFDTQFSAATGCSDDIAGKRFAFSTDRIDAISCWSTPGCILMVKVRMFYNRTSAGIDYPHPVGIDVQTSGTSLMPAQGIQIESLGESGESSRKVRVFEGYPEPPFIFDAAIFGESGLSKP